MTSHEHRPLRARPAAAAMIALLLPLSVWAARLAPVELTTAHRRAVVETLNLTGTLSSPNSARLSPDMAGRLVAINVEIGDRVEAGDVLFRLDDELARLELEQAAAAQREAASDLKDAERRLNEVQALVEQQNFPESEARSLAAEVERRRATLARRRAERAHAAAMVERYRLKAPFDGIIAARRADPGERVDPDTDVLELVAVDRLHLDLQVPQSYFGRVSTDTPMVVHVDALGGETVRVTVSRTVPVSDPNARTFTARAAIDNRDGVMTPGMSVRAALRLGTGRRGVVVPRDALIRYPDGRVVVWVANGDGGKRTVEERRVEPGLAFDGQVEIVEGLSAGETVVVRGNETLQQGQDVRVAGQN